LPHKSLKAKIIKLRDLERAFISLPTSHIFKKVPLKINKCTKEYFEDPN